MTNTTHGERLTRNTADAFAHFRKYVGAPIPTDPTVGEQVVANLLGAIEQWQRLVDAQARTRQGEEKRAMTSADHYGEAVRLLELSNEPDLPYGTGDMRAALRAQAQIHATLACVPQRAKTEKVRP